MTATALETVPDTARLSAASALQTLLPRLVTMGLDADQAHWTMTGPAFLPLHVLTDEIAADAQTWADRVAERARALGFALDGRPGTVAAVAGQFPAGRVADREVIVALGDRVATTARGILDDLEPADDVAHRPGGGASRRAREVPLDAVSTGRLTGHGGDQ